MINLFIFLGGISIGVLISFPLLKLNELMRQNTLSKTKKEDMDSYRMYAFRRAMGYTNEEMEERSKRAFGVKIK